MHLVTGGSGFFGNLVVKNLTQRGETVRILDTWRNEQLSKEVEFIQGDIRDPRIVKRALMGIDIVHHTAALVPLTKSGKDFWTTNVEGTRVIAKSARDSNVKSIIHLSSSAVYGLPKSAPVYEDTPHLPIEIYGRSKSAAEIVLKKIFEKEPQRLIIVRPRTILGEGRLGIFQTLFEWIRTGRPIFTIGSGNILFQFVHADDLLDAYLHIMERSGFGDYNVGTENFGTLNELFMDIIEYANSKSRIIHLPEKFSITSLKILDTLNLSPFAPWHYKTYHKDFYFDLTKIKSLGWKSKFSNLEMFQYAYDHYIKNLDTMGKIINSSPHTRLVEMKVLKFISRMF